MLYNNLMYHVLLTDKNISALHIENRKVFILSFPAGILLLPPDF